MKGASVFGFLLIGVGVFLGYLYSQNKLQPIWDLVTGNSKIGATGTDSGTGYVPHTWGGVVPLQPNGVPTGPGSNGSWNPLDWHYWYNPTQTLPTGTNPTSAGGNGGPGMGPGTGLGKTGSAWEGIGIPVAPASPSGQPLSGTPQIDYSVGTA